MPHISFTTKLPLASQPEDEDEEEEEEEEQKGEE